MNNTTKLIIAGAVGVAAFFGYKAIKKELDEKKAEDQASSDAEKMAKEAQETKQQESKSSTGSGSRSLKKEPTEYERKVMILQELLTVGVDGDAGKQTNGNLDYWWSSNTSFVLNADKSMADGYLNLVKNGKGVVSPSNVDYYIKAMQDKASPRHNANRGKSTLSTLEKEGVDRKNWGQKIFNFGVTGKRVALKIGTGSVVVRPYIYDSGRKSWIMQTGGMTITEKIPNHLFSAYTKIGYTDLADNQTNNLGAGYWILKHKVTGQHYIVNPYLFSAY